MWEKERMLGFEANLLKQLELFHLLYLTPSFLSFPSYFSLYLKIQFNKKNTVQIIMWLDAGLPFQKFWGKISHCWACCFC